jgi:hypothetical protein
MLILSLVLVPFLNRYQGMHAITGEEQTAINQVPPLKFLFGKAKRWYDHMWLSLASTGLRATVAILVGYTFFIVLTDIGWLTSWNQYGADPDYTMFFLMARASGQPNGAHLPSYISIAALGLFAAWKFKDKAYSISADFYQGILIVGFAVAVHEGLWLIAYFARYYVELGLALTSNFIEDFFFGVMCIMLIIAYWKYPFRTISLKAFKWPIAIYAVFLEEWFLLGLPVSTINNWQIGQGVFGTTQWFANPLVNAIEIAGWLLISSTFAIAVSKASCYPKGQERVLETRTNK